MTRTRRKIKIYFYVTPDNAVLSVREPLDNLKNLVLISVKDCDLIDRARTKKAYQSMIDKAFSVEDIG